MDLPAVALALFFFLTGFAVDAGVLSDKAEAASAHKETFVEGSEGWRFLPSELLFADKLASSNIGTIVQPAVDAINDFSKQLKQAGIVLVVVPVPPKVLVHGAALGIDQSDEQRLCAGWRKIVADIASQGVQIVDLLDDYAAASGPMYCRRDTHWSGPGIDAALARLLPVMQSAGVEAKRDQNRTRTWQEVTIQGDLGGEPETVKLMMQGSQGAAGTQGPVLLLGDSHVLVFHEGGEMHTTGAGLPEQLASVLGSWPQTLGVRGSGATSSRLQLARRLRSRPDFLAGTKIVIWVFAGREFTEADMWKKIPLFANKPAT